MKKVEMLFYSINPSVENTGLKFVLFEVVIPSNDSPTTDQSTGTIIHDWGFADWLGTEWDKVEAPEGFTTTVKWWANTLEPDVLLKDKPRIIKV